MNKILDKPLPKYFLGDELRMMQILVNLLSNSAKFTPSGGSIYLIITTDPDVKKRMMSPGFIDYVEREFIEMQCDGYVGRYSTESVSILADSPSISCKKRSLKSSHKSNVVVGSFDDEKDSNRPIKRKRRSSTSLFGPQEENYVCMLYFIIADTGIGITEAQEDNIFTPFFRTTMNSSSQKELPGVGSPTDGVGLGLTIAKYFVEEMNGHIDFFSEGYNKGSVFCIGIPYKVPRVEIKRKKVMKLPKLARASTRDEISVSSFPHLSTQKQPLSIYPSGPQKTTPHPQAHSPHMLPSSHILFKSNSNDRFKSVIPPILPDRPASSFGKILIAEDNEVNRSIIQKMIEKHGYSTDLAENGRIAFEKCKQATLRNDPYILILMDIEMPCMGGIETTKKIRDELGIDTPIIALSAHAVVEIRELALKSGFNDFITKPFSNKTLIDTLKKFHPNGPPAASPLKKSTTITSR